MTRVVYCQGMDIESAAERLFELSMDRSEWNGFDQGVIDLVRTDFRLHREFQKFCHNFCNTQKVELLREKIPELFNAD